MIFYYFNVIDDYNFNVVDFRYYTKAKVFFEL